LPAALIVATTAASAHDTWFKSLTDSKLGTVTLALGTGNQFPVQETGVGAEFLRSSGCRSGSSPPSAFTVVSNTPNALVLRANAGKGRAPLTCWAQLVPFDIELPPDKIPIYLKEINAPQSVHDRWAQLRSRGVPWIERYTKHARIELSDEGPQASNAPPATALEMGMDVVLESGLGPLSVGDPLVFRVLRDGKPLPDFAVELRSDRTAVGIWLRTDAEGRVRVKPPLAGNWVLRGTDLRPSETTPDAWDSRFVTLAFSVRATP